MNMKLLCCFKNKPLVTSLLSLVFGVFLIVFGFDPSQGEGVYNGVQFPSRGASFSPIFTAIGVGFVFISYVIYKHCYCCKHEHGENACRKTEQDKSENA